MNTLYTFLILATLIAPTLSHAADQMTAKLFQELVAAPGDTNALRKELASVPFWRTATVTLTMKYQDGKILNETIPQTAKTVGGKYIVFSNQSQYYHQTTYAIVGYDEKASAIHEWGLFGGVLTESTLIFDPTNKVSPSLAGYGDGYEEISAGAYSDTAMTDNTGVYKNRTLFMTRDAKTVPTMLRRETQSRPRNPTEGSPRPNNIRSPCLR
jgi:hypothetical protein